ncbi:hypothetical protein BJ166DRAFT_586816 [Pestalotiopsis sp. NC0098]|nr:hypothetical protein BJ166DRAFT_586816 [Pestalotiopsis sp. NC0098]
MAAKQPQVTIIGAGLSGLALGLGLQSKGIASVLYERAASPLRNNNYGITLYPATYRPLLPLVDMDEAKFRSSLAVDASQGGAGRLSGGDEDGSFRCHRGKLERLLRRSLPVEWNKRLQNIETPQQPGGDGSPRGVTAVFEDGHRHQTACLIGCDGPHSRTRLSLTGAMPEVLPYVVFKGLRRMPLGEYLGRGIGQAMGSGIRPAMGSGIRPAMGDGVLVRARAGDVSLEVSVDDSMAVFRNFKGVKSAKAEAGPQGQGGGGRVPEAFYEELGALLREEKLEAPFAEVFDVDKVRKDRVLHWLMRTVTPDAEAAAKLAARGVLLIGDAAHAEPILGGRGAQVAIQDGLELAEYIASNGIDDLGPFAESRYEGWKKSVEDSKKRIADLHAGSSHS